MRTCEWVSRSNPGNQTIPWRCDAYPEAAANCRYTCGICETDIPSASPTISSLPTLFPLCPSAGVEGNTYYSAFDGDCYEIDFFIGGTIDVEVGNADCENYDPANAQHVSIFDSFTDSTGTFVGPIWTGTITVKEDPNVASPTLEQLLLVQPVFHFNLYFSSCPEEG